MFEYLTQLHGIRGYFGQLQILFVPGTVAVTLGVIMTAAEILGVSGQLQGFWKLRNSGYSGDSCMYPWVLGDN